MSNENRDKDLSWKMKLENLEHLPGEDFNKDASWNKLHERLQNKKKRMPTWYWAAAACLVFGLMVVWIMKNDNVQTQIPKDKIANKQPGKINREVPVNEDIASNETEPVIVKEKTKRLNKINQKQNKIIIPTIVSKLISNDVATDYLKDKPLANSSLISNTSLATSLKPVEKKKLNVVHVNELGDPVNDFPVANHIDKRVFKFEIAKGEVVSSAVSQSTDFTISKIKSTSN